MRYWDNNSGTAGNWFDPQNWGPYHDYPPGCGENPVCPIDGGTTEADINNFGKAQISGLTQTAYACETFLGKGSGQSGNLSIDHATLDMCNEMWVGYQGKGVLSITDGGLVSSSVGANIGALPGSNGAVTVDGTNPDGRKSTWTVSSTGALFIGGQNGSAGGTGLLTVSNSGMVTTVSVHVYKSGTLTGNSSVSATNGTTIEGTVSPSGGTLSFVGDLNLQNSATTQCNVTPQDNATSPQVSVSGQVSLDGRLSVTMTGDFSSAPTRYTLLHANSVDLGHRTFFSMSIKYPTDQGWGPKITYDYVGNNVYLDRVYDLSP